jgi:hypothetical protein
MLRSTEEECPNGEAATQSVGVAPRMPSGPDLVRSPEICASGSEVPGFEFGILIIFFVIGISLAVQPDSSLANLPPANDRASNRPGVPSQRPACVSATHAR